MGKRVHGIAAEYKLGPKLTDRACPEAHSHLLFYAKLFHTASQHDCAISQGLAWLMSMSLMVQGEKQQSSQDHYTRTELSVYTQTMWPVLKSLIQCTVNITLIPLFHLNVSSQFSIHTSDVGYTGCQDRSEDNRLHMNDDDGGWGGRLQVLLHGWCHICTFFTYKHMCCSCANSCRQTCAIQNIKTQRVFTVCIWSSAQTHWVT